jgi:purine-binding chemotaxis protein CheW
MSADPVAAVVCAVGEQYYAVPVANILEVAALVKLMPLPDPPQEVLGVVNRQGQMIPVLDLRLCLGKDARALDLSTLFIVVQAAGYIAGLVVDDVREVVSLQAEAMRLAARSGPYLQGMTVIHQMPVLVLDTAALLRAFAPSELAAERSE